MLKLPARKLSKQAREGLQALQDEIDGLPTYAERVDAAKQKFGLRNRAENPIFSEVRSKLAEMSGVVLRCSYCEDSVGNQVEHIRPKNLYPEAVFTWSNYAYACSSCNGPKNDGYAIVERVGGRAVAASVARRPADPLVPPRAGTPGLLNPRSEDPLRYLKLDLIDTFLFTATGAEGSNARARAEYTIELLHLNDRGNLPEARYAHYHSCLVHLEVYVARKQNDPSDPRLQMTEGIIARLFHRTVWAEMQRQHADIPELKALFDAAPEALSW